MGEGDVVLEPPLGLGLRDPAKDKVDKVQCVPKSIFFRHFVHPCEKEYEIFSGDDEIRFEAIEFFFLSS